MIKANDEYQIVLFVMEPEEELQTLRFLALHKGVIGVKEYDFWTNNSTMSLTEQATRLGLTGGYFQNFLNLSGGSYV
jgi:hypothetical protein